ncbi:MAG: hypothetical protein STSR0008_15300 [Ignavibacterium sp.]
MWSKLYAFDLFVILLLSLLFFGCQDNKRIDKLEKQIDSLRTDYSDLKRDVSKIQFDKFLDNYDKVAYLTPGSDGYSSVRFDLGVLTISITNIFPYANGSKVTLRFGNTLSSTINGLKATAEYGPVDEKGISIYDQMKTKELSFIKSLRSGSWTNIEVVLDGVPPDKLGYVRIKDVTHTGIELLR